MSAFHHHRGGRKNGDHGGAACAAFLPMCPVANTGLVEVTLPEWGAEAAAEVAGVARESRLTVRAALRSEDEALGVRRELMWV